MKKFFILLVLCLLSSNSIFSQMIYKNEYNNVDQIVFGDKCVIIQMDQQPAFSMPLLGIDPTGTYFTYGNNAGGIAFTLDFKKMTIVVFNKGNMEFTYVSGISPMPNGYSSPSPQKEWTKTETCSYCNGKGWIVGSSTPTYGNTGTKWCSECQMRVPRSHSHDECPSCRGRGTIKKVNY